MTWNGTKIPKINKLYIIAKAFLLLILRAIEKAAAGMTKVTANSDTTVIIVEFKK